MSSDLNSLTIIGRVVRDAGLKYTNSGLAICEFSIANNYRKKSGEQWTEEVNFFDCVLMGRRGESVSRYLIRGCMVGVNGDLRQQRWEKDGQKRSRVTITVRDLQLLGGSRGGQESPTGGPSRGGEQFQDDVPF